jgi:hypothetical protein
MMKGRVSILLVLPLLVFGVFAALLWALGFTMVTQYREDVFAQTSGQALRLASRLARIAEVNLDDHIGKLEEHVMFASIEMNASAIVVLDPAGRIVLAHDSSWKGGSFSKYLPMLDTDRFARTTASVGASRAGDPASNHIDVLVPFIFPLSAPGGQPQRGAVFVSMDYGDALSDYQRQHVINQMPILTALAVFAALLALWLYLAIVRPLRYLTEASNALFSRQITGVGEVGELERFRHHGRATGRAARFATGNTG